MASTAMQSPGDLLNELGALNSSSAEQGAQPLLLVTTVDIGGGKADRIEVRRGDVPANVASAFVTKHGLPPAIIPRLAVHLEENLAKVESQKQQAAAIRASKQQTEGDKAASDAEELAVFHRLYEQAVALRHKLDDKRTQVKKSELESIKQNKTTMSWISSEMMRDRSSGPFGNYGEMLYAESLESLARKKERADRRKQELVQEETAGATFHPEISRLAQNLWSPHECASVPAWQRLSKGKLSKAQERLEMLRREKEEAEMKECTFRPQLSDRSEKLMTERSQTLRSLNVSAHQQLYQDAMRRQQKQQDYQHWYPEEVTFQPKLHESAMSREFLRRSLQKEASSQQGGSGGEDRHLALVNRLYASYEKLQNKLQEARSSLSSAVDPATGKRLFHPETGRAPNFARRGAGEDVGDYLYSLKQQQEQKVQAAAEALERKRQEAAAGAKSSQGSRTLLKQLQQKRFRQIFDFLDHDGLGCFDLVGLIRDVPEWMDDLDDEVRSDLEAAAKLLSKRILKQSDSSKSDKSEFSSASFFMPPPPTLILAGGGGGESTVAAGEPSVATSSAAAGSGSYPGSPSQPGVVTFQRFCALMEEILGARRGPRVYLAPSPPRKYVPTETYRPQIDERSKLLAAKKRPKDTPAFELLYQEGCAMSQKLREKRAEAEAAETSACTFAPRLVSHQLVKEGRVMKGVRDGTWYKAPASDSESQVGNIIDDPDSLQALAASVMEEASSRAAAAAARVPGLSGQHSQAAAEEQLAEDEGFGQHGTDEEEEVAERLALEQLQLAQQGEEVAGLKQQQQREIEQLDQQLQAALEEQRQLEAELLEHRLQQQLLEEAQQAQQQAELELAVQMEGAAAATNAAEDGDECGIEEGTDEHRQYLELEREVQQMLVATSAAAAAAGKMSGTSTDHEYLSEILGLAQEQVDAMAPAICKLQGLQLHHSRAASSTYSAGASPATSAFGAAAGAAAGAERLTPKISFKVDVAAQQQQQQQLKDEVGGAAQEEEEEEELPLESHSFYVPASPSEEAVAAAAAATASAAQAEPAGAADEAARALVEAASSISRADRDQPARAAESRSDSSMQQPAAAPVDSVLEGADLFELAAGVAQP